MTDKQITDTTTADAIKESRAALRGVNSHVAKILAHIDDAERCMSNVARRLRNVADGMGEIYIKVYDPSTVNHITKSAKKEILSLANELLEGAAK